MLQDVTRRRAELMARSPDVGSAYSRCGALWFFDLAHFPGACPCRAAGSRRRVETEDRLFCCICAGATLDSSGGPLTLNYMVKYGDAPLDRTFAALADPTRRALLARLAEQPDLSISALAEPFAVSLPA